MFPSKLTLNYNLRYWVKTQYHCCSLLPAFQVQLLIWTGSSGSSPEQASFS